jgi:hypothetical protein
MIHRRRATLPGLALWMLVAVGDLALVIANLGVAAVLALVGVMTAALAAVVSVMRRAGAARDQVPVAVPVRRRG